MGSYKDNYFVTESARKRFKKWLINNDLTFNDFADKCGTQRQYLQSVINGKNRVTPTVREWFKKGGYDML